MATFVKIVTRVDRGAIGLRVWGPDAIVIADSVFRPRGGSGPTAIRRRGG